MKKFTKFFENSTSNEEYDQKSYINNTVSLKAYFNQPATEISWNSNNFGEPHTPTNGSIIDAWNHDKTNVGGDGSIIEVVDESAEKYKKKNKTKKRDEPLNKSVLLITSERKQQKENSIFKSNYFDTNEMNSTKRINKSPMISRRMNI